MPVDAYTIRDGVAYWGDEDREDWEERAAIMEYDGGMTCEDAERHAYRRVGDKISRRYAGAPWR